MQVVGYFVQSLGMNSEPLDGAAYQPHLSPVSQPTCANELRVARLTREDGLGFRREQE
jgi:hypothetical protein